MEGRQSLQSLYDLRSSAAVDVHRVKKLGNPGGIDHSDKQQLKCHVKDLTCSGFKPVKENMPAKSGII